MSFARSALHVDIGALGAGRAAVRKLTRPPHAATRTPLSISADQNKNSGRTKEDSSGEGACQPGGDI